MATKKVVMTSPDNNYAEVTVASDEGVQLLRRLTKLLEPMGVVDASTRQRVAVETCVISSGTVTTVSTVTTCSTVTSVTSLVGLSGVDAKWFLMDTARNAYANGIRANISF